MSECTFEAHDYGGNLVDGCNGVMTVDVVVVIVVVVATVIANTTVTIAK